MAENPNNPADWYADPADPTLHRWWDGAGWTDRLRPAAPLALVTAGTATTRRGSHFTLQLDDAALAAIPKPKAPSRYFADQPTSSPSPLPPEAQTVPPGIREVYRQSREIATIDQHRIVHNPAATIGIALAILIACALAAFQYYGLPFTFLFAPSVVTLAVSGIAVGRARLTGAAMFRSCVALVLGVPLAGVTVWAFAEQLAAIIPIS